MRRHEHVNKPAATGTGHVQNMVRSLALVRLPTIPKQQKIFGSVLFFVLHPVTKLGKFLPSLLKHVRLPTYPLPSNPYPQLLLYVPTGLTFYFPPTDSTTANHIHFSRYFKDFIINI